MIKTEEEYQFKKQQILEDKELEKFQRTELEKLPLSKKEVDKAMQPLETFNLKVVEEVEEYEKRKKQ